MSFQVFAMTFPSNLSAHLQTALDLSQTVEHHGSARQIFQDIVTDLQGRDPEAAAIVDQLWRAYLSAQRSSLFWEQISQAEKRLSDQLTEHHVQLKRNYLRLMQEQ